MKYTGYFRSLKEKLYRVEIQTGSDSTPAAGELTLGPAPFTTQMENGTTIYSPVKYQSANVQIVNNEYMFSLYASTAKQNTIKLYDASDNILFTGYGTPNMYDAPYDFVTETYNVEALDGLAILRYYDYDIIGSVKDFRTFAEIINHLLTKSACYSDWYWSTNTSIPNVSGYLPNLLTISEQCFFDEDDEPMKMNEVLEEICRYCGVTAYADGSSVYFIDYEDVSTGGYVHYNVGSTTATGTVTKNHRWTIIASDYANTGSNLTLKGTFSKVTVKDSLYAVENIIPPLFEDEDLKNIQYQSDSDQEWAYTYSMVTGKIQKKYVNVKYRSYTNNKYNHYYYDASTWNPVTDRIYFNNLIAQEKNGIGFFKYQVSTGETSREAYDNLEFDKWDNYLLISNNFSSGDYCMLDSKNEFSKPFFMSTKTKFIFKGDLILSNLVTFTDNHVSHRIGYFPSTDIVSEGLRDPVTAYSMLPKDLKIKFGLSIGNYSVIGDSSWASGTSGTISIPFCERSLRYSTDSDDKLEENNRKKHEIFFKSFPICNNVEYWDKISEDGFMISCDSIGSDMVIAAKPKISVYMITDSALTFLTGAAFIKDFDIKGVIPHEGGKDENDTDTEYTYVVDSEYVSELQPITFKICTYDGKQLNYSAVAYPYSNNYKFVDNLHNNALNLTKRAEEICCYKIAEQYKDPVKVLTLNLYDKFKMYSVIHEYKIGDCVVDTISHDYKYDKVEITLEHKS
jgi:hypothetical protein